VLKRHTADTVQTCEIGGVQAISCDLGRRHVSRKSRPDGRSLAAALAVMAFVLMMSVGAASPRWCFTTASPRSSSCWTDRPRDASSWSG